MPFLSVLNTSRNNDVFLDNDRSRACIGPIHNYDKSHISHFILQERIVFYCKHVNYLICMLSGSI